MVLSVNWTPLLCELCRFLPLIPLKSRHKCDMPVRSSHLSTADCHLGRLSSTTSFLICLFRTLSFSSAGVSMLCCSRCVSADCGRVAVLSTKGIVSLISINRPPPLFMWRKSRTAAHPGDNCGFVLVGQLGFLDIENVDIVSV